MKLTSSLAIFTLALFGSFPAFAQMDHSTMSAEQHAAEPQYLEKMTMHHQDGVEMAQLATEKASSKEVKNIGKKIIKVQNKEIKQLQAWKKKWHSGTPAMGEMKKMDMSELKKLSGKEFDTAFLDMMSKHHEEAVSMSKEISDKLQHKEVKDFAAKTVANQQAEIDKMQQMKKKLE